MSSQSYIFISSRDKVSGTPNDFSVFINPNNHIKDYQISLSIKRVVFKNLEYGVNSKNNTLVFEENGSGTDLTTTITAGNYDSSSFATALKTALELVGANTYTVSFSDITKKYTISADGVNTFRLATCSLNQVLGFPDSGMTSFANSATSSYPINLSGTDYVDIYTNLSNQNISSSGNLRGFLLARVPVAVSYGGLVVVDTDHDASFYVINSQSLQELRIQLYDDKNRIMELADNAIVSIKFLAELV